MLLLVSGFAAHAGATGAGSWRAKAADPAAEYGDGGGRMLSIEVFADADGGAGAGRGTETESGFAAVRLREFSRPSGPPKPPL